jgi:Fur family ferric uptake transcriptional regulator
MQLLEQTNQPVDVSMIIAYLKKEAIEIDPATVFRIMNAFTQKGITTPIDLHEGKTRYELTNKHHHHHLICNNCGNIEDVVDVDIAFLEKNIAHKHAFLVQRHALEFFGLCINCQK